jgi:DNA-binding CsgD family transcriptional regulator
MGASSRPGVDFAAIAAEMETRLPALAGGERYALYAYVHRVARRLVPVDAFSVFLAGSAPGSVYSPFSADDGRMQLPEASPNSLEGARLVLETGSALRCHVGARQDLIPPGALSAIYTPMRAPSGSGEVETLGALFVCTIGPSAYSTAHQTPIQWLADRLACLLRFEESERQWREMMADANIRLSRRWNQVLSITKESISAVEEIRGLVDALAEKVRREHPSLADDIAQLQLRCKSATTRISEMPMRHGLGNTADGVSPDGVEMRLAALSDREREILELLAEGQGNLDIAQTLYVSPSTVKFHKRNILRKLGVSSRAQAVLLLHQSKE